MRVFKQYINQVMSFDFKAPAARLNMPPTTLLSTYHMHYPFQDGFPILTAKKMPFYSILGELIGFINGVTDVREFERLGCSVWWDNAYNWNVKQKGINMSMNDYKAFAVNSFDEESNEFSDVYYDGSYISYDLGAIYSELWTSWGLYKNAMIDQVASIFKGVAENPFSRYHVITAWDPSLMNNKHTCQPNCHVYYQATAYINYMNSNEVKGFLSNFLSDDTIGKFMAKYDNYNLISGHLTQRSCDMFLGVPFNVTSYSLLTILLSLLTGNIPYCFDWVGVNNHIYSDHVDAVNQYLKSPIHDLPRLWIDFERIQSIEDLRAISNKTQLRECFKLENYTSGEKIYAKLSVGM